MNDADLHHINIYLKGSVTFSGKNLIPTEKKKLQTLAESAFAERLRRYGVNRPMLGAPPHPNLALCTHVYIFIYSLLFNGIYIFYFIFTYEIYGI